MAAQKQGHEDIQVQLQVITRPPADDGPSPQPPGPQQQQQLVVVPKAKQIKWWLKVLTYAAIILTSQTAVVLLARLYFVKGGASKWLVTTVQLAGFPLLIPYYLYHLTRNHAVDGGDRRQPPSNLTHGAFYTIVGLLTGGSTYLYSTGIDYLPVSTSTLIASSQLAFNAFFSYFLNSQKFTPLVVNSLFLLTVSSVLLVFAGDPAADPRGITRAKYTVGFLCTLASAAASGMFFSVSEYAFRKVLKVRSLKVVMNMLMFQGMVASGIGAVGLLASGDWKGLGKEMENYELGKVGYVMTLVWTGVTWELFAVATMALVFEVSSVFSNAVGTVGLPLAPIMAVVIFDDRMSGVKAVAMVLALWGFLSYLCHHYLDGRREENKEQFDH
ncbi:unnamed protein product [Linum trigynum]|uniref:Probable purine permease n=1 Tax=Linum trigynum TaxID=586398 RepID=A0AAV2D5U9_9ROSI